MITATTRFDTCYVIGEYAMFDGRRVQVVATPDPCVIFETVDGRRSCDRNDARLRKTTNAESKAIMDEWRQGKRAALGVPAIDEG